MTPRAEFFVYHSGCGGALFWALANKHTAKDIGRETVRAVRERNRFVMVEGEAETDAARQAMTLCACFREAKAATP